MPFDAPSLCSCEKRLLEKVFMAVLCPQKSFRSSFMQLGSRCQQRLAREIKCKIALVLSMFLDRFCCCCCCENWCMKFPRNTVKQLIVGFVNIEGVKAMLYLRGFARIFQRFLQIRKRRRPRKITWRR